MTDFTPDQIIDAARLRLQSNDPNNPALTELVDYLEHEIVDNTDLKIRDGDDLDNILESVHTGIGIISSCHASGSDVEDPLTEEVGGLAEPMDDMVSRAIAASKRHRGDGDVYDSLQSFTNQLRDLIIGR